jgi:hypothetical protein
VNGVLTNFYRVRGWCRGTFAQEASGDPVACHSQTACQFCISGALSRLAFEKTLKRDEEMRLRYRIVELAEADFGVAHSVATLNDRCFATKDELLAWLARHDL